MAYQDKLEKLYSEASNLFENAEKKFSRKRFEKMVQTLTGVFSDFVYDEGENVCPNHFFDFYYNIGRLCYEISVRDDSLLIGGTSEEKEQIQKAVEKFLSPEDAASADETPIFKPSEQKEEEEEEEQKSDIISEEPDTEFDQFTHFVTETLNQPIDFPTAYDAFELARITWETSSAGEFDTTEVEFDILGSEVFYQLSSVMAEIRDYENAIDEYCSSLQLLESCVSIANALGLHHYDRLYAERFAGYASLLYMHFTSKLTDFAIKYEESDEDAEIVLPKEIQEVMEDVYVIYQRALDIVWDCELVEASNLLDIPWYKRFSSSFRSVNDEIIKLDILETDIKEGLEALKLISEKYNVPLIDADEEEFEEEESEDYVPDEDDEDEEPAVFKEKLEEEEKKE